MIAINIVTNRFNKTEEFAQKLAQAVWYQLNSKDIRDVIKVARLARNEMVILSHCIYYKCVLYITDL